MSDENQELLDSQDLDDVELDIEEEENFSEKPAEVDTVSKDKYLRAIARAKRAEQALKTRKPSQKEAPQRFDEVAKAIDEKVELRLEGYSVEDINDMSAFAKGKGITLAEAKQNAFVKSVIDARKAEREAENSTLKPSNRSVMVDGKSATDILRDPKASADEKQRAFEAKRSTFKPRV
jgi:hypothetical protein